MKCALLRQTTDAVRRSTQPTLQSRKAQRPGRTPSADQACEGDTFLGLAALSTYAAVKAQCATLWPKAWAEHPLGQLHDLWPHAPKAVPGVPTAAAGAAAGPAPSGQTAPAAEPAPSGQTASAPAVVGLATSGAAAAAGTADCSHHTSLPPRTTPPDRPALPSYLQHAMALLSSVQPNQLGGSAELLDDLQEEQAFEDSMDQPTVTLEEVRPARGPAPPAQLAAERTAGQAELQGPGLRQEQAAGPGAQPWTRPLPDPIAAAGADLPSGCPDLSRAQLSPSTLAPDPAPPLSQTDSEGAWLGVDIVDAVDAEEAGQGVGSRGQRQGLAAGAVAAEGPGAATGWGEEREASGRQPAPHQAVLPPAAQAELHPGPAAGSDPGPDPGPDMRGSQPSCPAARPPDPANPADSPSPPTSQTTWDLLQELGQAQAGSAAPALGHKVGAAAWGRASDSITQQAGGAPRAGAGPGSGSGLPRVPHLSRRRSHYQWLQGPGSEQGQLQRQAGQQGQLGGGGTPSHQQQEQVQQEQEQEQRGMGVEGGWQGEGEGEDVIIDDDCKHVLHAVPSPHMRPGALPLTHHPSHLDSRHSHQQPLPLPLHQPSLASGPGPARSRVSSGLTALHAPVLSRARGARPLPLTSPMSGAKVLGQGQGQGYGQGQVQGREGEQQADSIQEAEEGSGAVAEVGGGAEGGPAVRHGVEGQGQARGRGGGSLVQPVLRRRAGLPLPPAPLPHGHQGSEVVFEAIEVDEGVGEREGEKGVERDGGSQYLGQLGEPGAGGLKAVVVPVLGRRVQRSGGQGGARGALPLTQPSQSASPWAGAAGDEGLDSSLDLVPDPSLDLIADHDGGDGAVGVGAGSSGEGRGVSRGQQAQLGPFCPDLSEGRLQGLQLHSLLQGLALDKKPRFKPVHDPEQLLLKLPPAPPRSLLLAGAQQHVWGRPPQPGLPPLSLLTPHRQPATGGVGTGAGPGAAGSLTPVTPAGHEAPCFAAAFKAAGLIMQAVLGLDPLPDSPPPSSPPPSPPSHPEPCAPRSASTPEDRTPPPGATAAAAAAAAAGLAVGVSGPQAPQAQAHTRLQQLALQLGWPRPPPPPAPPTLVRSSSVAAGDVAPGGGSSCSPAALACHALELGGITPGPGARGQDAVHGVTPHWDKDWGQGQGGGRGKEQGPGWAGQQWGPGVGDGRVGGAAGGGELGRVVVLEEEEEEEGLDDEFWEQMDAVVEQHTAQGQRQGQGQGQAGPPAPLPSSCSASAWKPGGSCWSRPSAPASPAAGSAATWVAGVGLAASTAQSGGAVVGSSSWSGRLGGEAECGWKDSRLSGLQQQQGHQQRQWSNLAPGQLPRSLPQRPTWQQRQHQPHPQPAPCMPLVSALEEVVSKGQAEAVGVLAMARLPQWPRQPSPGAQAAIASRPAVHTPPKPTPSHQQEHCEVQAGGTNREAATPQAGQLADSDDADSNLFDMLLVSQQCRAATQTTSVAPWAAGLLPGTALPSHLLQGEPGQLTDRGDQARVGLEEATVPQREPLDADQGRDESMAESQLAEDDENDVDVVVDDDWQHEPDAEPTSCENHKAWQPPATQELDEVDSEGEVGAEVEVEVVEIDLTERASGSDSDQEAHPGLEDAAHQAIEHDATRQWQPPLPAQGASQLAAPDSPMCEVVFDFGEDLDEAQLLAAANAAVSGLTEEQLSKAAAAAAMWGGLMSPDCNQPTLQATVAAPEGTAFHSSPPAPPDSILTTAHPSSPGSQLPDSQHPPGSVPLGAGQHPVPPPAHLPTQRLALRPPQHPAISPAEPKAGVIAAAGAASSPTAMAGVAAAAGATAGQSADTEAVAAKTGQGVLGAGAAHPPGISARARAREELQAQLIQGILRMHARSKVDLASLMSYLQSALQTRADAASAGSEPRQRPLPATDTGRLAKRQRRGPAADVVLESVFLDSLLSTALEHRSELFGNHVRVTGQRLMLAVLHMAHQNNSAAHAAMRNAAETVSASSAARAENAPARRTAHRVMAKKKRKGSDKKHKVTRCEITRRSCWFHCSVSFRPRQATTGSSRWLDHASTSGDGHALCVPALFVLTPPFALACQNGNLAWLHVIKVPEGAVLRGCKKTRRKLREHLRLRAEIHSQLRFIASFFVLRIFLTCLVGYPTPGSPSAPQPPAVQPPQPPDAPPLPPLPQRAPAQPDKPASMDQTVTESESEPEPVTQPPPRRCSARLAALAPAAPTGPPLPLDCEDPTMMRQLKDFCKFFANPNFKTVYNQLQRRLGRNRHPMLMPAFEDPSNQALLAKLQELGSINLAERIVKLYAKAARAKLGWSGEEAQLLIRMACGYGINAHSSELEAATLDKGHVADLIEEANTHRRLLGMKKEGSLQDTLPLPCRMRHAVHVARAVAAAPHPPCARAAKARQEAQLGLTKETQAAFTSEPPLSHHWARWFNTNKLRNKEFAFERLVDTDGVSVCVHYTRPLPPPPAPPPAASSSSTSSRPSAAAAAAHAVGPPHIGRGIAEMREFVFDPDTQIGVGIDPGVTQAVSAASGVWDPATGQLKADQLRRWKLTKGEVKHASGLNNARRDTERWLAPIKPHLQHLAAARSAGTSQEANLKHITVTLATWDAVWEVYLDPKWARQRLRLYGAQDRALKQFFNKLEREMAELSMKRHGCAKQLVVFFGAASIGTAGGWGADAVLRACRKVVCRPRGKDQDGGRVVLVDEHRTTRVSSAVNGKQPCEVELNTLSATRPAGWKPPAGQVHHRLVRPAWSQERGQPVGGLVWCPVVAPRRPPQAPRSSQAATQPAASEPGPSTPQPAKRSKRTKAEPAAEPTKGKGKVAKAKPAPQTGRWLDRDCNAALNMQRIGESRWRPLELCYWPDQGALPAKGKEYPGLGYKRLRDKPPKAQEQQQPAEAQ
ncbi:hypothetical protein QJQ45_020089 [Haematococcus lacustris]|nr:hypothetical protein QJQ45_020089 [Haematococcus lacustris]